MTDLSRERQAQLEELRAQLEAEQLADKQAAEAEGFRASDLPLVIDPALATVPMGHQVRAMNFCATLYRQGEPGVALLMEQGTGKSLVAIGLATAMARKGAVKWALVVCPNSLKGTWAARDGEIQKHSRLPADITVLRGRKADRNKAFRSAMVRAQRGTFQWVVTNIDQFSSDTFRRGGGAWTPTNNFQDTLNLVQACGKQGLLILDESSKVKNPSSRRTQALHRLATLFGWRMVLTGTPVTKSPLDVWAQFEVLKRGALGIFSFLGFERHYGIQQRVRFGNRTVVQTVNYRHLDDLEEKVSRLSFRALAKDCLDLPEVVRRTIPVELSPEQERAHQELKTEMMAELGGNLVDGRNILTRFLRLAQIIGGSVGVMDEDGQPTGEQHAFDPNPKLDAVAEYLDLAFEDPAGKAVVFTQFRAEIAMLEKLATQRGWAPVVFHGDISEEARDEGRQRFQADPDSRIFIAQYQTGSFGLNLTAANHLLFFGLTFDLELWSQARKRVHRKGQERLVNEVIFQAVTGAGGRTMDHLILAALDNKQGFADVVTGDRKALLEDVAAL